MERAQRGVLSRGQLLDLGFSPKAIRHRLSSGRLRQVGRGVYVVGRPELTREGRWMAAILACGEEAFLSHRSAAALYGISEERPGAADGDGDACPGLIEVSVRRRCTHRRAGVRARSRPSLRGADVGTLAGIPTTSPLQTMLDLATVLGPHGLERAVNEADKREVIDPETLRVALEARSGEPGVRPLRTLLDRDTFLLSDSDLEILFRPIAAAAGLPQPLTKDWIGGFEVDFHWPELGLLVETDGWRYHRTPAAQRRDATRDQTHTAAGLTTLRFSHWQVKYDPTHIRTILAATATHLRAERIHDSLNRGPR